MVGMFAVLMGVCVCLPNPTSRMHKSRRLMTGASAILAGLLLVLGGMVIADGVSAAVGLLGGLLMMGCAALGAVFGFLVGSSWYRYNGEPDTFHVPDLKLSGWVRCRTETGTARCWRTWR